MPTTSLFTSQNQFFGHEALYDCLHLITIWQVSALGHSKFEMPVVLLHHLAHVHLLSGSLCTHNNVPSRSPSAYSRPCSPSPANRRATVRRRTGQRQRTMFRNGRPPHILGGAHCMWEAFVKMHAYALNFKRFEIQQWLQDRKVDCIHEEMHGRWHHRPYE